MHPLLFCSIPHVLCAQTRLTLILNALLYVRSANDQSKSRFLRTKWENLNLQIRDKLDFLERERRDQGRASG